MSVARFETEHGALQITHVAVFILIRVCHLLLKYCILFF